MSDPKNAKASGVLLQVLPTDASATDVSQANEFAHISKLTETLTKEEMFSLSVEDILYRLYHQEDVEVYPAKDDIKSLTNILDEANDLDLIISSGGASVGDYDIVQRALEKNNFELLFWRIAMRPGKPLFFGLLEKIP